MFFHDTSVLYLRAIPTFMSRELKFNCPRQSRAGQKKKKDTRSGILRSTSRKKAQVGASAKEPCPLKEHVD